MDGWEKIDQTGWLANHMPMPESIVGLLAHGECAFASVRGGRRLSQSVSQPAPSIQNRQLHSQSRNHCWVLLAALGCLADIPKMALQNKQMNG